MHIVLLCGGSGKRLWPLSNEVRSKLFMELLPAPDGGRESMIGRVIRQLDSLEMLGSTLIVAHRDQAGITGRHTKELVPVLGEPFKKGTFTAAALSALHLQASGRVQADDILCLAPADVFADEQFFRQFMQLPDVLKQTRADIALLGTRPTHASEQYGYILPGAWGPDGYASVTTFAEKPKADDARSLLHRGALWNCGVYAFTLSYMLSEIKKAGLPLDYDALLDQYESLPERSFDKQVAEHAKRAVVVSHNGLWKDIGSWDALTEQLDVQVIGQGSLSGQTPGSFIVNELPLPLHVIGLPGIIAAASPDGILIADKKKALEIKEHLGNLPLRPMYGETAWGRYRVIDRFSRMDDTSVTVSVITVLPGKHIGLHEHRDGLKSWTVLSGKGTLLNHDKLKPVQSGDHFTFSSPGSFYSLLADTPLEILETIMSGEERTEEPVRFESEDWNTLLQQTGVFGVTLPGISNKAEDLDKTEVPDRKVTPEKTDTTDTTDKTDKTDTAEMTDLPDNRP